ncbi:nucleotide exchange factor GrpE [Secundilactobacillus paracollinoides]|uniref:nucleotide exchange factor GrpE n=1 Tax=Secundilactobacillus paracollinoides TaxID=240427 RepID=UPI0006CFF62B|nr:nucleotide exchange factor GrpE [Secundilactobacillus paracollinoides]ANZ63514.1 nucleotide exchange factor GrpE [Secundilactobacillus paracollinoides]KRL75723.1 co-chaperone GrpE [Secundilactobacillus paracollinoides DSM 15502 = JCM 11969]
MAKNEANKPEDSAQADETDATKADQTTAADAQQDSKTDATEPNAADQGQAATDQDAQADDPLQEAQRKIADLQKQVADLNDRNLRSQAEIQNIQSRNKKDQAALIKYDGQQLAHDVLPALDNLERALQTQVDGEQGESLKKGIEMVQKHLLDALTNNGVTEIKAAGEKFDPNIHQAVQTVPAEDDDHKDHVVQVLQKGYQLKDRVLRPAMVVVSQ